MKVVTPVVLAILCIAVAWLFFRGEEAKLAYVESDRLLASYAGMQDAGKVYQQKVEVWRSNIDTLRLELQQEVDKYEQGKVSMSAKERELSEELIATKQKQLLDYQRSIEEKAAKEDQEMTKQVLDKVNAYIKQYGKDHGYRIIMAATHSGNIVYAEDDLDITDEILEGLNNEYSGK